MLCGQVFLGDEDGSRRIYGCSLSRRFREPGDEADADAFVLFFLNQLGITSTRRSSIPNGTRGYACLPVVRVCLQPFRMEREGWEAGTTKLREKGKETCGR